MARIPPPEVFSYDDLRPRASTFLDRYWPSGEIPVDIEHIADVEFGIDLIPVTYLLDATDVDGFLAADGREIWVDEWVFSHRLHRYRFTIAHELAHVVLHERLVDALNFDSIDEWRDLQASISEEDRSWYEWQAYAFAGLVLVPPSALTEYIDRAVGMARSEGFEPDLAIEAHRTYLAEWVGRRFEVSGEVILRRGSYDDHWEL